MIRGTKINSIITNKELHPYKRHLNKFSGLAGIKDTNHQYVYINKTASNMFGFSSPDNIHEMAIYDEHLNCPAAELTEIFKTEDTQVFQTKKKLCFMVYAGYANNEWKTLVGEKNPLFDDAGNVIALNMSYIDISNTTLAVNNFSHNQHFQKSKSINYKIGLNHDEVGLTKRESETLYYLLRANTAKSIGRYLNISPRTVEDYVANLKLKFKCHTSTQLIEKAVDLGYHNIIPESIIKKQM